MTEKLFFEDIAGRGWCCRVDWSAMQRSQAAGVDLSRAEEYLGDFYRGSALLINALWAVVGPEATKVGVTREMFEQGIRGETIEAAREALLAGLEDFFPKSRGELMRVAADEVAAEIRALVEASRKRSIESPAKSG